MKRTLFLATPLLFSCWFTAATAGEEIKVSEPAAIPLTPSEVSKAKSLPTYRHVGESYEVHEIVEADGTRRIFRPMQAPPRRRAFIRGNYRYEPRIRDIRMLPVNRTMPQTMPGSIETLPVLPPRVDGYFVVPIE